MEYISREIKEYLHREREQLVEFLCQLIRFPTVRGNEGDAQAFLHRVLTPLGDEVILVPIPETIMDDPDYAFPEPGLTYANRPNLMVNLPGKGEGRSLIINTHIDVVPAPSDWKSAFQPENRNGTIIGRGACDCKGQIAVIYAILKILKHFNVRLKGNLAFHIVIEEEVGGNGTLHCINQAPQADGAIILEPSSLDIHPAVRGAVWFEIQCEGRSAHSGEHKTGISAVKMGIEVMSILERYHDDLLSASRGNPYFDIYENPMPITFGMFQAGNWPSTVPQESIIKGLLGFLPNKNRKEIQEELRAVLQKYGDKWLQDHVRIRYPMLNNDGFSLSSSHPLITTLIDACNENQHKPAIRGMTASCDAWMYNKKLQIPTIVFGAGDLRVAHSIQEQITIEDITMVASILSDFILSWCGKS